MTGYVSRVRSLLAGITPGPWKTEPVTDGKFAGIESRVYSLRGSHILLSPTDGEAGQAKTDDAAFIAEAPTAVTHLLARLDAVEAIAARLDASLQCEDREIAEDLRAALAGEGE